MIIDSVPNVLDGVECHDFLKEGKRRVTRVGVWEGGDRRSARPGDNGRQEDTDQDCAPDTIHHEKGSQKAEWVV